MTTNNPMHIVLTAGGTGGHMFPARALAEELLARGNKVSLVTDLRGAGFGDDLTDVTVYRVSAGGVAGGGILRKVLSLGKIFVGTLKARKLLKSIKADVVVAFGGYASVPAGLAAGQFGIPLYLHEQNAVLGRANRLMASKARGICTSFKSVSHIPQNLERKITLTGNPVRPEILSLRDTAYQTPDHQSALNILVTGGSQGATVFNTVVPEALALLPEEVRTRLNVSQQVRGEGVEIIEALYKKKGIKADLRAFFDDMPTRLAAAHIAICRSGASTVTELAAAGRPAILVPYPHATDDHQTENARDFTDAGAGWLMAQGCLEPQKLADRLISLFSHTQLLERSASCARSSAITGAASNLADVVCGMKESNGDEKLTSENVSTGAVA
ncbi:undecaprenyldiphospho-muramoylpentapeptide beta-N-acetylglucosaminyltransferase [Kiloniella sp. EL199]|uniref:undecaprenyldiphospho-muramoylpentapeptide beta-N-acetylglucosaminyltransferase n=1 Tax=Kiloniella sp. EL199 TaxID=2107581 RepID=UPI000EA06274|nr:undecaprenyldiphospho-muramoylpentapeptide beta-N-acetylglucosaminyltransferase [Kiloniella sp. EL199]